MFPRSGDELGNIKYDYLTLESKSLDDDDDTNFFKILSIRSTINGQIVCVYINCQFISGNSYFKGLTDPAAG